MRSRVTALMWVLCGFAASSAAAQTAAPANPAALPTVDVTAVTPLSGSGIDVDKAPAAVTIITQDQIQRTGTPNVARAIEQQTPGVTIQDVSGNAFQPDIIFRGFDASPIEGTPEGIAVYQNGVRINEAFGDVVNWDLIPTNAIRSMDLISNNPAFGFNALGGALSVKMKDGFSNPGGVIDISGGSFGRLQTGLEYGKKVDHWAFYGALEMAHDQGYRTASESDVRRVYGDLGYAAEAVEFHLNVGFADNDFGATASAPIQLLQQNASAIYTSPQTNGNQLGFVNLTGKIDLPNAWSLQGGVHVRVLDQRTVDGNATNVQPCANPALLCFNDSSTPANGLNGQQLTNPFAADAVLGEIDRTKIQSTTVGASLQATNTANVFGLANQFVVGATVDRSVTNFEASAELGTVAPDYFTTGSGIFLGPSGNPVSDGPVALVDRSIDAGVYVLDSLDVTNRLTVTAGGRLNIGTVDLQDRLGGGLDGDESYWRVNPMIGATFKITDDVSFYGSYSEANRIPSPLELGCANPAQPCILASFLVSDPKLKQVVARTYEAGFRGYNDIGDTGGSVRWRLGAFHTVDSDDILNLPDPQQQGFGYFTNVGNTLRQGIEADVTYKLGAFSAYLNYAYVDARFLSSLALGSNSPSADSNGLIYVTPGDQIPLIPHNRLKTGIDYNFTRKWAFGADILVVGQQRFAGDASNQQPPLPAYWLASMDTSYKVNDNLAVYARVENIFNTRYYSYGGYFDTSSLFGNLTDPRSVSPGEPRGFFGGVRATF